MDPHLGEPRGAPLESVYGGFPFAEEKAVGYVDKDGNVGMGPLLLLFRRTHVGKWWKPIPRPDYTGAGIAFLM